MSPVKGEVVVFDAKPKSVSCIDEPIMRRAQLTLRDKRREASSL